MVNPRKLCKWVRQMGSLQQIGSVQTFFEPVMVAWTNGWALFASKSGWWQRKWWAPDKYLGTWWYYPWWHYSHTWSIIIKNKSNQWIVQVSNKDAQVNINKLEPPTCRCGSGSGGWSKWLNFSCTCRMRVFAWIKRCHMRELWKMLKKKWDMQSVTVRSVEEWWYKTVRKYCLYQNRLSQESRHLIEMWCWFCPLIM